MAGKKVLVVNRKVEVSRNDEELSYKSLIQEVGKETFSIQVPSGHGQVLNLHVNDQVQVRVWGEQEQFLFSTGVVGKKKDRVPLYILQKPKQVKRIQLRNFVRVKVALEVSYQLITQEEREHYQIVEPEKKALTIDLSGGGVQLMVREEMEQDSFLVLSLGIPQKGGCFPIKLLGRVRRCEKSPHDPNGYLVGVAFEDIWEREQDRIVEFVFEKLLHQGRV